MKRLIAFAVLALVAAGPAVADAQASGRAVLGFGQDRGGAGARAPLAQVLRNISARYPGRHLNTTTGDHRGRPAYFVQWQMENGQVVVFVVDAESGQVIGRQ
jgi:uncharacterized membrane protein YkoI